MTDNSFGKLVAFGLGGVLVELLKDITSRLAPATHDDAISMLDGIQAAEMLKGVRESDPVSREALSAMIVRVPQLISDFPRISELDLNPVLATVKGAIAAEVRIVMDFAPKEPRHCPSHDEIVLGMNKIMRPKALAVIGASPKSGKIGNSVIKNLINGSSPRLQVMWKWKRLPSTSTLMESRPTHTRPSFRCRCSGRRTNGRAAPA